MYIYENKSKNERIQKLQEEIYFFIAEIKQSMSKFNTTTNVQFARDAVEIYVKQMQPKIDELVTLKYKVNLVEYDESNGTYHLIQKKLGIATLEDNYVEPSVISFVYGDVSSIPSRGKTKPKQKMNLVVEQEDQFDNMQPLQSRNMPVYNDDGTIRWENPEYQNMWNKLPLSYKKALLSDGNRDWLLETMDQYVQNKKENKPLVFVAPSNLIIPPQVQTDGTYNFGNIVYNNIFNKFDKSYLNTLLTLYSEKNGNRDYTMMMDTVNNLVKQQLGFNNYL